MEQHFQPGNAQHTCVTAYKAYPYQLDPNALWAPCGRAHRSACALANLEIDLIHDVLQNAEHVCTIPFMLEGEADMKLPQKTPAHVRHLTIPYATAYYRRYYREQAELTQMAGLEPNPFVWPCGQPYSAVCSYKPAIKSRNIGASGANRCYIADAAFGFHHSNSNCVCYVCKPYDRHKYANKE